MELSLNLPAQYVDIEQEEMMYLDGGLALSAAAVVKLIISAGGIAYGAAYAVGTRVGWMDTKKGVTSWYNSNKWGIRSALIIGGGLFLGGIALLGFENGLYSTLNSR